MIITQLVNRSAKGDLKATQMLLAMQRDIEGQTETADAETSAFRRPTRRSSNELGRGSTARRSEPQ